MKKHKLMTVSCTLVLLLLCAQQSVGNTDFGGGVIQDEVTLFTHNSPYIVREDVSVGPKGTLRIQPGVEVRFAPMIGITVLGKLIAEGEENRHIVLTSVEDPVRVQGLPTVRFVDGPDIVTGRLQLLYKGKWRSVCTNTRNWTAVDLHVTCRQLGFIGGEFYQWYEHNNLTRQILYERPNCTGTEQTIQQCQWNSHQMGGGVCDHHPNLGIRCFPFHAESPQIRRYWRGILFNNALFQKYLTQSDTLYVKSSFSSLRYVDIRYAGSAKDMRATSALETVGVPPRVDFLRIRDSAYNGMNISTPKSVVTIRNAELENNRGYGAYVNTTHGLVLFQSCNISSNGADGIKYMYHDLNLERKADTTDFQNLCTFPVVAATAYPLYLATAGSLVDRRCTQYLTTKYGYVLTLHFVYMYTGDEGSDGAEMVIRDGNNERAPVLAKVEIKNGTWPQSVVSTKNNIFIEYQPRNRKKAAVYIAVTAGHYKAYDLNVTKSIVNQNNGPGISVVNVRNSVHVHRSVVTRNNYAAGIYVTDGAGDVNVTHSHIAFNEGDGINITYAGGSRNISYSSIYNNDGSGMVVWFNETSDKIPNMQETIVEYSEVYQNALEGVFVGNFCGPAVVNVSGNVFNESQRAALTIQSCWHKNPNVTLVQVGNNYFYRNKHIGVQIEPPANMFGKVEYNYFAENQAGCLSIKGIDLDELESLPVALEVSNNRFEWNSGSFVVGLGLSQYSVVQSLLFTLNFVRNNTVEEPFPTLKPRSHVAAPVVVSSPNVAVFRNVVDNYKCHYEVGSHLQDQSYIINATYNWLGSKKESVVYYRVFDRKDRYNLARIQYFPFLLKPNDPNTDIVISNHEYDGEFRRPGSNEIGGEITGVEELTEDGVYLVKRDISVRPGGKLTIASGITLKFEPTLGMMVGGNLHVEGYALSESGRITMSLLDTNGENSTDAPVRLVGSNGHEGRLQVRLGNTWGTVCDYDFDIRDAALVCHQLGLVLNPNDWLLERSEMPAAGTNEKIILSNVRCTEYDYDITKCVAEHEEDLENSCTHDNDVGIRCYSPSWAGVRLGMTADKCTMKYVLLEKAGLLDYSTNSFKPALQVDFARHVLEYLKINNNFQDGLGVSYSDIYFPDTVNIVKNSEFSKNLGDGISIKQLGLELQDCEITYNKKSGIMHNPSVPRPYQRDMTRWIANIDDKSWESQVSYIPDTFTDRTLQEGKSLYLVTKRIDGEQKRRFFITATQQSNVIGIQLLNPIHNESTEEIIIRDLPADSAFAAEDVEEWNLKRDLVTFPTVSSAYGITIEYSSGNNPRGQAVILVTATKGNLYNYNNNIHRPQQRYYGPIPQLKVKNSHIRYNERGISAYYYNRYLNEMGDLYLRKANESIEVFDTELAYNKKEAVYFYSPFRDIYSSNMSENTFMMNRTLITDNAIGVHQFSRDLRNSNNLFHWIMQDNTFERNKAGGFDVSLPYVWQYNENHTHSVYVSNNTFRYNQQFKFDIDGHFAAVSIYHNNFENNMCENGLLSVHGMEKETNVSFNRIEGNTGNFMFEINTDSQSEILGEVQAYFRHNRVQNNRKLPENFNVSLYQPSSFVIGLKGLQKMNVTNNLFGQNAVDYELLSGIRTARLDDYINVRENWWGTTNITLIKERIFDFDDWNCYTIAEFRPYYIENRFNAPVPIHYEVDMSPSVDYLGGRFYDSLVLHKRDRPYIVRSDVTVMPDVTLTIAPGAVLEFYPSVGILVLGSLWAQGSYHDRIIFRPVKKDKVILPRPHAETYFSTQETVRLCTEGKCPSNATEGFVEFYNQTTLQWVPLCDQRFTERNAQVVCRQLGLETLDVYVDFGPRIEYHINSLAHMRYWPEPYQCSGSESRLEDCDPRLNGQLYGYEYRCDWNSNFVFVHCGQRNLDSSMEYWGGIRFSVSEFEQRSTKHRLHDTVTHSTLEERESILEYAEIMGAGILHNEKSPAIQAIMKSPILRNLNVTNSSSDAINLISAPNSVRMLYNRLADNMGIALNILSLTGEASDAEHSSFMPLRNANVPYNLFGMVDACDTAKEFQLDERIILYYKYDNNPVDCVKIFYNVYGNKNVGFRLLQLNLFNSTGKPWPPDSITLYDGDIYNYTSHEIARITMEQTSRNKLYKSKMSSLSIKLHATGASENLGFIAEVISLPVSPYGIDRDVQYNLSYSIVKNNERGAVFYGNAGEVNPIITLDRDQIDRNGLKFYGNFTSCETAMDMDVQNTPKVVFKNNLVRNNIGGLHVRADSGGSATSLQAYIHNNLFTDNSNHETILMEGRRSSPYQEVIMYRNYFTRSNVTYEDMIVFTSIVTNLTFNYLHNNIGQHIMKVAGFDNVRRPVYQTFSHNSLFRNFAIDRNDKGMILVGSAGQQYVDNVFFNPDSDYELVTMNRSLSTSTDFYYNTAPWDIPRSVVDARNNWWGYNVTSAVGGRIRDFFDDFDLLEVAFEPYLLTNRTLLSGKCSPGWTLVGETCYIYIGGPMNFYDAKAFCRSDNASMPYVMSNYNAVLEFLRNQQEDFQFFDMVWVQNLDMIGDCTVFVDRTVRRANCDLLLPFLCESDPKVFIDPLGWTDDTITVVALGCTGLALLLIVLVMCFWLTKSRKRRLQRLERRNSIRASIRSLASTSGFSDLDYRRRIQPSKGMVPSSRLGDYDKMNGSFDSIEKSVSQFNSSIEDAQSYDIYETRNPNTYSDSENRYAQESIIDNRFASESVDNDSTNNVTIHQPFNLAFQNKGFRDNSTFSSQEFWNSRGSSLTNGGGTQMTFVPPPRLPPVPPRAPPSVVTYANIDTTPSDDQMSRDATLPLRGNRTESSASSVDYPETPRDFSETTVEPLGLPVVAQSQPNLAPKKVLETNFGPPAVPVRTKSEFLETHFDAYEPQQTAVSFARSKSQPLETAM